MSTSCKFNPIDQWKPARVQVSQWLTVISLFRKVHSTIKVDRVNRSVRLGEASWMAQLKDSEVGLCWCWREVRPNVVALSDPLRIKSNAVFYDDHGKAVPETQRILFLNSAVHDLSWQQELVRSPSFGRSRPREKIVSVWPAQG